MRRLWRAPALLLGIYKFFDEFARSADLVRGPAQFIREPRGGLGDYFARAAFRLCMAAPTSA
jgi:hypothetical protein